MYYTFQKGNWEQELCKSVWREVKKNEKTKNDKSFDDMENGNYMHN